MRLEPGILARGPWELDAVVATWRPDAFVAPAAATAAADAAIAALVDRGSPAHDGQAARLTGFCVTADNRLELELQPMRWSLRLVEHDAGASLSALCVVRDSDGRWLAGRRAAWLASWAGRWALGAGGAVEVGENPAQTLVRELEEEWSVRPQTARVEALVATPGGLVLIVGSARLAAGARVVPDSEHDEYAWWPAEVDAWPAEADEHLRRLARMLA